MNVVLLALDSNEAGARTALQHAFPDSSVITVSRTQIESATTIDRIKIVRALRPEVFAVSMENLDWQRGQTLLSLFASVSGASRVVAIDSTGRFRSEPRLKILLAAPFRLLREAWKSFGAVFKSRYRLAKFERAVKRSATTSPSSSRRKNAVAFVFLRATPGPGTQAGGASSHINGFINAARAEGASIGVISNDHIAGLDTTKVPFTLIPLEATGLTRSAFDLNNNLIFTAGALEAIRSAPPDFIYQRYSRFTWAGVAASLLIRRPLFLEYNGSEVWVGKHWDEAGMFGLLERFEKLNLAVAARIFVVSEVERRNLLRMGVADQKIVVNPNGVDTERFKPNLGGERIRTEFEISRDEQLVGFVGTFGPWHGVLELAQAITLLQSEPRLRFLLIGAGKLKKETEKMIREAGLQERVIFTGSVAHERVPSLLDACDILVAPHVPLADGSDFFGSPTKLFEYMAMGKGIVASRLGQIGEVLVNEETALLVEPGDSNELAAAISRLARAKEMRMRLGANARKVAAANYTWQHNARRVLDAFANWANERSDPEDVAPRC